MRHVAASLLCLGWLTCAAACQRAADEPRPAAASEAASPQAAQAALPTAAAAADDEDEEELELDQAPLGMPPIVLDEMDRAALETACFEGRLDACDRLGH